MICISIGALTEDVPAAMFDNVSSHPDTLHECECVTNGQTVSVWCSCIHSGTAKGGGEEYE